MRYLLSMPPQQQGLASAGRGTVEPMVMRAWDAFTGIAEQVDLQAPTRLPGWRAHEVCVHLGAWDNYLAVQGIIASASGQRDGDHGRTSIPDPDEANAIITRQEKDASREEVLAALHRGRQEVERYFATGDTSLDTAAVVSTLGPLPLLSVLLGQCYELAVHALDLVSAGAPAPPEDLLQTGLAALADVTGAVAHRVGITDSTTTLWTPNGGWTFSTAASGWSTTRVDGSRTRGTAVEGRTPVVLDCASGRMNPVAALARRQLKVHSMAGLTRLAPIVESVPGIPGGPTLRLAARALSGAGGVVGRFTRS